MTWKPDVMLYHANCADGFGAAWAAWKLWGDDVEYIPVSYGERPPEVLDKHVLIGDFSYKRDGIDTILQGAKSLIILDHHKTAEAELKPFAVYSRQPERFTLATATSMLGDLDRGKHPPVLANFDMNRSGARMVWNFCHPDRAAPALIEFIEDRDLWQFKYEITAAFGLWLRSEPFSFARWSEIHKDLQTLDGRLRIEGEAAAMQRFFDQKVAEIAAHPRWIHLSGYTAIACNCPNMFASEVGHKLLDAHPGSPFAVCYSDQGETRSFSLRSADDRVDVAEVARKFGGGGHRNAAGFGVPLP
jgi:oligoribonuclease NrnB/cAMP/cGMP phosphodiesterase (DHH superfamily)